MLLFVKHLLLSIIFFLLLHEAKAQYVFNPDALSFEEKLAEASNTYSTGIHIGYQNLDSTNHKADIIFQLYFPKKMLTVLLRDFGQEEKIKSIFFRNLTIIFKGVKLKWDSESQSLVSTDSLIQLGTIGNVSYDKPIAGGIELSMGPKFNRFSCYLTAPDSSQYLFSYKGSTSQMTIYSTDSLFMEAFEKVKNHGPFFDEKYKCNGMSLLYGTMAKLDKFIYKLEKIKIR